MSTDSQSNTRVGDLQFLANETLTDKEGHLAVLTSNSGVAEVRLPNDKADSAIYVITEGAASGSYATVRPLSADRNVRLKLKGTCNPGALLVPVVDGSEDGRVETVQAGADIQFAIGIAEEAGVDDQLVRVRPLAYNVFATATTVDLTSTDGTAAAASADLAALAAEAEKIGDDVRAIHAALVAQGILATS